MSIGQYAAVYVAIGQGLGRPIKFLLESPHLLALNKVRAFAILTLYYHLSGCLPSQANYAALVLWIVALFASKVAAIVFMSRFAQPGRHRKEILGVLVTVVILGLGSLLALVVDCRVVSSIFYWDFPSHRQYCPHPVSPTSMTIFQSA